MVTLTPSSPTPPLPLAPSTPAPTTPVRPSGTFDEAAYIQVRVHTAKCTECDQRNKDLMRRCPGCAFQICRPCYERRVADGRGMRHGNTGPGSVNGSASAQRVVRRKVGASGGEGKVKQEEMGEGSVHGVKRLMGSYEDTDGQVFVDGSSPTPKRRRIHPKTPAAIPSGSPPRPLSPITAHAAQLGVPRSELNLHQLLDAHGVDYPDDHILKRLVPVLSNPDNRIPNVIRNSVRPAAQGEEKGGDELEERIQKDMKKQKQMKGSETSLQPGSNSNAGVPAPAPTLMPTDFMPQPNHRQEAINAALAASIADLDRKYAAEREALIRAHSAAQALNPDGSPEIDSKSGE